MNNDIYLTERIGKINFCGKKEEWSQAGSPGMEENVPSYRWHFRRFGQQLVTYWHPGGSGQCPVVAASVFGGWHESHGCLVRFNARKRIAHSSSIALKTICPSSAVQA
jgi:hypothetical protein